MFFEVASWKMDRADVASCLSPFESGPVCLLSPLHHCSTTVNFTGNKGIKASSAPPRPPLGLDCLSSQNSEARAHDANHEG